MLHLGSLPKETKHLIDEIAAFPEIEQFTLIGGTALALSWGHRRSEDLDFAIPRSGLPREACSAIIDRLDQQGWAIADISNETARMYAENDGNDLADTQQDWLLRHESSADAVKLTFFADYMPRRHEPYHMPSMRHGGIKIMSPNGIFSLKSQVILRRTTSRDLYDIWSFLERGRTVDDILTEAIKEDRYCSYERLRGRLLPSRLPSGDPGLETLVDHGPSDLPSLKACLQKHLDLYEADLAARMLGDEGENSLTP